MLCCLIKATYNSVPDLTDFAHNHQQRTALSRPNPRGRSRFYESTGQTCNLSEGLFFLNSGAEIFFKLIAARLVERRLARETQLFGCVDNTAAIVKILCPVAQELLFFFCAAVGHWKLDTMTYIKCHFCAFEHDSV